MANQNDLFDIATIWRTRPLDAFGAFVRSEEFTALSRNRQHQADPDKPPRTLSAESAKIYLLMFGNFLRWIDMHKVGLYEVTPAHLKDFLEVGEIEEGRPVKRLNSLIRVRYLRLLERVYTHLQVSPNPARHAALDVYRTPAAGRDKPKVFLREAEQIAFLEQLPQAEPYDPAHPDRPSWKKRRDRAMLAMMLGAGLKVSELLALRIDQIGSRETDGSIPVKIPTFAVQGAGKAHDTILRPFAVKHVLPWIEERKQRAIPSKLLFPASLHDGGPLNKATVYRHVKATMEKAGLAVDRMGGRTLRNSFAVRELENGSPVELVKQFLGHHETRSTRKYEIGPKRQRRLLHDVKGQ